MDIDIVYNWLRDPFPSCDEHLIVNQCSTEGILLGILKYLKEKQGG